MRILVKPVRVVGDPRRGVLPPSSIVPCLVECGKLCPTYGA